MVGHGWSCIHHPQNGSICRQEKCLPELDLADSRSSIADIADVSIPPFRRMDDSNLAAYMKDSGGNVVVAGYVGFQYICNGKFHHASLTIEGNGTVKFSIILFDSTVRRGRKWLKSVNNLSYASAKITVQIPGKHLRNGM